MFFTILTKQLQHNNLTLVYHLHVHEVAVAVIAVHEVAVIQFLNRVVVRTLLPMTTFTI